MRKAWERTRKGFSFWNLSRLLMIWNYANCSRMFCNYFVNYHKIVFIQLEHVNKNPLLCLSSRNSGETRSTKQKEKTLIFHILIIYIYIYIFIYTRSFMKTVLTSSLTLWHLLPRLDSNIEKFLPQETWNKLTRIVSICHKHPKLPLSLPDCKGFLRHDWWCS